MFLDCFSPCTKNLKENHLSMSVQLFHYINPYLDLINQKILLKASEIFFTFIFLLNKIILPYI